MPVNEAMRQQWNAESQARTWPKRERITLEVTPRLLDALALQPGEKLLEIGSGGGLAAIDAAAKVGPAGSVTGFDLSAPLVALATERAAEAKCANVTFIAGDAQTDTIAGAPFDAAMSQFGVMFFDDPVAAFTNIRRHVRAGGRLAFACWQPAEKNAWYPGRIFAKYVPPPSAAAQGGGPPPGPFAFGDQAYVEGILAKAGFTDIRAEDIEIAVSLEGDAIFDRDTVDALRIDDATKEKVWEELQAFRDSWRGSDGQVHLTITPRIVRAANP